MEVKQHTMGQRLNHRKIRKHLETNDSKSTTYQNLLAYRESSVNKKFMPVNTYTEKDKNSEINNLILYLKEPEKEWSKT